MTVCVVQGSTRDNNERVSFAGKLLMKRERRHFRAIQYEWS